MRGIKTIEIVLKIIGFLAVVVGLVVGIKTVLGWFDNKPKVQIRTKPYVEIAKGKSKYLYTITIDIVRFNSRKEGSFGISNIRLESNVGRYNWTNDLRWGYDPIHEEPFTENFESFKKVDELKGKLIFTSIYGDKMKANIRADVIKKY